MEEAQSCLPLILLLAESPALSGNGRGQSPASGAQPCSPPLTSLASLSLPVPKPEREALRCQGHCLLCPLDFLKGYSHRLQTTGLLIPKRSEWERVLGGLELRRDPSMIAHHLWIRYERLGSCASSILGNLGRLLVSWKCPVLGVKTGKLES